MLEVRRSLPHGQTGAVILRRAVPGDEPAVAGVHARSWRAAYRGLLPDTFLDTLGPDHFEPRYTFGAGGPDAPETVVAEEDGKICGFATVAPAADPDVAGAGELTSIHIDPEWWSRGIGRLLLEDARARMVARGWTHAVLWMLEGNERADRFYRRDGWEPDGALRTIAVHGEDVQDVRYGRPLP